MLDQIRMSIETHYVSRWNGTPVIGLRRTISQHHYEVAMITNALIDKISLSTGKEWSTKLRADSLQLALIHDLAEVVTGDVSYVTKKKYPELKQVLETIEDNVFNDLKLKTDFDLNSYLVVKTADIIAVSIEIKEQIDLGNSKKFTLNNPRAIIESVLKKYKPPYTNNTVYDICCEELLETQIWNSL